MFAKFKTGILILLYCVSNHTVSARNIDSLLASHIPDSTKAIALSDYAFGMADRNPDSAMFLAKKAQNIAIGTPGKGGYAQALNAIGWSYFRLGKNDSAKWYILNAENKYHALNDVKNEARTLINLGSIYQNEQNYEPALDNLLKAMQLIRSPEDIEYVTAEKIIGCIYRQQGNLQEAKKYLTNASNGFLKLNEMKYYADAFGSLGLVYLTLAGSDSLCLDSAAYCCNTALNIYLQQSNLYCIAYGYEYMGQIYFAKSGEKPGVFLDSSLHYYMHAYDMFCKLKDTTDLTYEKMRIGEVLIANKQYPLAQKYLSEAQQIFQSEHQINNVYNILVLLSNIRYEIHDYEKAYDYLKQANAYNDTLQQQNKDKAIADMLAKYETDKKDQIIAHNLYRTRVIEVSSIMLILLSVAFAILLMNRYRIKQKLHELQLRNDISNDLHDDVGSSLSSIMLLSNLAAGAPTENKPELINKISENALEAIERISDIIWATNPKYDDGENLRAKIINYIAPLCQVHNITLNVNISEIIKNIKFPMETRKNIFLIIKEAMNNIFKHSGASEISLNLFFKEKKLVIEITDNGHGFDINVAHNGNGLKSMLLRTKSLCGELLLDTKPGSGTKILVMLPASQFSSFT